MSVRFERVEQLALHFRRAHRMEHAAALAMEEWAAGVTFCRRCFGQLATYIMLGDYPDTELMRVAPNEVQPMGAVT